MAEPQMVHNVIDSPESQYLQLQSRISRSNEKKFICNYLPDCKAAFSRQEHLQRHIRKHTGERPFSCGCGRTFTRLDNLRQHAQTVHSGTVMAQISDEQNAIAAATKMRPTPNSPPPRVQGSSETDPYPRPVMKLPRTTSRPSTRDPSLERQTPPATIISTPPSSIQQEVPMPNPYETMTFMPSTLDTHVDSSSYHPPTHSYPAFRNALSSYTPNTYHNAMQHSDVESSVGSQPISSLVKRRAPKHDFVYTGGHMMHSPGTIINSNGTDFDFSRHTADTTPDEGEQMSEYINNGLEPKGPEQSGVLDKDRIGSEGLEAMTLLSELAAARRD